MGFHKAKAQPIAYRHAESAYAYRTYNNDNDKSDSLESEHQSSISWSVSSSKKYPVNDYSGLNSLRARLAEAAKSTNNHANTETDNPISAVCHNCDNASCQCSDCSGKCLADGDCRQRHTENEGAIASLVNGADTLGLTIPYICYFKINTHDLTDNSQLDYLSEIVKLAKERKIGYY